MNLQHTHTFLRAEYTEVKQYWLIPDTGVSTVGFAPSDHHTGFSDRHGDAPLQLPQMNQEPHLYWHRRVQHLPY